MSSGLSVAVVYLDEGEHEGGIAHPTQDLISALEPKVDVVEVTIEDGRSSDPRYWYRLGRNVSKSVDVVHVQFEYGTFGDINGMFLGSMFPVFASAVDTPMVATLHNFRDRRVDLSVTDPASLVRFLSQHATWFVDRSLVHHTDFFVPLMKTEEALLERHGVPSSHIEHIPLVPEEDPDIRDKTASKRELGLEGKNVVTAFGWVRESKGYDRVIDVLPELPNDTVFLVAGGTRTDEHQLFYERLQSMVEERGLTDRVVFTGYVGRDEHPVIMSATDVMVFPYRDNRASDALARALSYNLPTVASANEEFSAFEAEWGCPRTVENDDELATAIREVLTDDAERERLYESAAAFSETMNWESVATRMVEIYENVTRSRDE